MQAIVLPHMLITNYKSKLQNVNICVSLPWVIYLCIYTYYTNIASISKLLFLQDETKTLSLYYLILRQRAIHWINSVESVITHKQLYCMIGESIRKQLYSKSYLECISTSFFTLSIMPVVFILRFSIILMATVWPVDLHLALYTQANPPRPTILRIW